MLIRFSISVITLVATVISITWSATFVKTLNKFNFVRQNLLFFYRGKSNPKAVFTII